MVPYMYGMVSDKSGMAPYMYGMVPYMYRMVPYMYGMAPAMPKMAPGASGRTSVQQVIALNLRRLFQKPAFWPGVPGTGAGEHGGNKKIDKKTIP
jgi:hypothetical protein